MTNFIQTTYFDDLDICDELINYIETSNKSFQGQSSTGVDKHIKDSIDCRLEDDYLLNRYMASLMRSAEEYAETFPYSNNYSPWGIVEPINIQKYAPRGGYHQFHTERGGADGIQSSRHLVFMTYLNNVSDCGETEFFHQDMHIHPEKGKTIIWPADWTHTHRGIPSLTETKYIVTGWFNYFATGEN